MGRRKIIPIIFALFLLLLFNFGLSQKKFELPPSTLKIEQTYLNLPEISLYFWITDSSGGILNNIKESNLKLTLNGKNLLIDESERKKQDRENKNYVLKKFNELNEGIAFTILIDISLSVKGKAIENIKAAALSLVSNMSSKDKIMIILVGSKVKEMVQFTNNKVALGEKIKSIKPIASNTLLYKAIEIAFSKNNTFEKEIPKRRALVVISDGVDEGSGITINDLKEKSMYPVYSVGFKNGSKGYIESLKRISEITGGQYLHLTDLKEADKTYLKITELIKNQWVLSLKTCDLTADGSEQSLELRYKNNIILSSKRSVKLFSSLSKEELKKICYKPTWLKKTWENTPLWGKITGGVIILLLLILTITLIIRSKKKKKEKLLWEHVLKENTMESYKEYLNEYSEGKYVEEADEKINELEQEDNKDEELSNESEAKRFIATETEGAPETDFHEEPEPQKNITGRIEISILEGENKGQRKELDIVDDQIKIGRGGLSDFMLDDQEASSEHAVIIKQDNIFYIQDNESTNGIYVNGIKIKEVKKIEKSDIILIGNTKFRFNKVIV